MTAPITPPTAPGAKRKDQQPGRNAERSRRVQDEQRGECEVEEVDRRNREAARDP
jgi:hypothetical protein